MFWLKAHFCFIILFHVVQFTMYPLFYHLSPCSSMVRTSQLSSEGYRLYTYVAFALPSQSM